MRSVLLSGLALLLLAATTRAADEQATEKILLRPEVPGKMLLHLQSRDQEDKSGKPRVREASWKVNETAIVIIDMWDQLYCKSATQRVGVLAPKMNSVISAARSHGVQIIHAPSNVTGVYEDLPQRLRMKLAPQVKPPTPIGGWCYLDPQKEPEMPVDTSECACDDPVVPPQVGTYTRQHPDIDITGYDGVSDNGQEIYNFLHQLGIKNVIIMGVHTNMCILGRPFGIRQMTKSGFNVVLARDLTDAMYDPRQPPFVSHTRGTELVIEHIETYWCPSILGEDLTKVIPGSTDPVVREKKTTAAERK